MLITYGSVCSGIEAATHAWHPLGMHAAWLAEIEAFPSAGFWSGSGWLPSNI
jgi:DNA (cytosine-5)-methyltransferase 1